jgi:hypothetical protein
MSRDSRRAPALRCLLLWSLLTTGTAAVLLVARAEVATAWREATAPGGAPFAPVLAFGATITLTVSVTWLWCVMTAATVEALHGVHGVDLPGVRGAVRRLVLAGCGVALAASVAPAHADDVRGVAGQPPQPLSAPVQAAPSFATHVVESGDSLWAISAARLGPTASDAEIDHAWRALWEANHDAVGPDPDLIEPGQRLDVTEVPR